MTPGHTATAIAQLLGRKLGMRLEWEKLDALLGHCTLMLKDNHQNPQAPRRGNELRSLPTLRLLEPCRVGRESGQPYASLLVILGEPGRRQI